MKKGLKIFSLCLIMIFLKLPAWANHNGSIIKNTATIDSSIMGTLLTPSEINRITQDGSGTVADIGPDNYFPTGNPGAFTNNHIGCIAANADYGFGNNCRDGANDPMTAPAFTGANNAAGKIETSINLALVDPSGNFTISGSIDFCLNRGEKCDTGNAADIEGIATVSQNIIQEMNLGEPAGIQTVSIDNRSEGSPVTFMTFAGDIEIGPMAPKNIPWSLDITQAGLHIASSGIYPYEVEANDDSTLKAYRFDGNICTNVNVGMAIGLTGSCWPAYGTFDLPGFDTGESNFPN